MNKYSFLVLLLVSFSMSLSGQNSKAPSPDSNDAIEYYKQILKRDKHSAFANYSLAYCYFLRNDFHSALKFSKKSIKRKSDFQEDSYLVYASSLDALGRASESIEAFEKAIKLFPENYLLYFNHALTCYKYRRLDKTISSLKEAVKLSPLFIPSHYLLGCALFEKSNDPESMIPVFYGLMIDGDSVRAQHALALTATFLNHKVDQISVPFFEPRLKINSIDQLLDYYFPKRKLDDLRQSFDAKNFVQTAIDYVHKSIDTADPNLTFYTDFFSKMNESLNTPAFCWYLLRYSNDPAVEKWFTSNSDQMRKLAVFLDENLPGKTQ